jgi:hypothetical protein
MGYGASSSWNEWNESFSESAGERRHRIEGNLSDGNRDTLEDYVHRLRSVEGLATAIHEYLDAQDRPFVFSLFGDHLPAMSRFSMRSAFKTTSSNG